MFRLLSRFRVASVVLVFFMPMFSSLLSGQTKEDIYLGYSLVSSGLTVGSFSGSVSSASAGRASLNGWEASASVRFLPWLRAVGDVVGGYGTVPVVFSSILGSEKLNVNTNLHTYLFGPRASASVGRLAPFGQVLFGLAHQSVSANAFISNVGQRDSAFAFDLGGGIDFRLVSRVAWRVQADYLQTKLFDSTQHDPRVSTGIVLRF
jgi:opacity protein-like surface antigen